jgi:hypothetical protein
VSGQSERLHATMQPALQRTVASEPGERPKGGGPVLEPLPGLPSVCSVLP